MRRIRTAVSLLSVVVTLAGCGTFAQGWKERTASAWTSSEVVSEHEVRLHYHRLPGPGCGNAVAAPVNYREDSVVIGLLVDTSTSDCAAQSVEDTFAVQLDEPLAGREIVDANDRGRRNQR